MPTRPEHLCEGIAIRACSFVPAEEYEQKKKAITYFCLEAYQEAVGDIVELLHTLALSQHNKKIGDADFIVKQIYKYMKDPNGHAF